MMNNRLTFLLLLIVLVSSMSCIYDPPRKRYNDITIINSTKDSLYYYIHDYKDEGNRAFNFAYDSTAAHDWDANKYTIAYNISDQKILPKDTLRLTTLNSWREKAIEAGGLTILFYKRNIQHLEGNIPLSDTDIFRRIDLTNKQLDSLKYTIVLN